MLLAAETTYDKLFCDMVCALAVMAFWDVRVLFSGRLPEQLTISASQGL